MRHAIRLAAVAALLPAGAAGAATLLHAGRLIDGVSDSPRERVTIVVDGGRIQAVEDGFRTAGPGDEVVDLSGATVLPGFMDMHVHLTSEHSRTSELDSVKKSEADRAYDSVVYAERTLLAGFTTVRNLGDVWNTTIALKRAIDAGKVKGPRIFTAGRSIGTRGGHADATNSFGPFLTSEDPRLDTVCNGADSCREAVRQRYKDGADSIKITATGGVLSIAKSGSAPQFTDEELEAVISTAHDYGMKVAAHAHGTEGIKRAVRNGIDSIEHGTFLDDEGIRLMKEKGTHYVPTISAGRWVYDQAQDPTYFPAIVRPKALAVGPQIQQTFGKAWKAGVTIMFGTDCGVCAHGDNGKEFGYMVEAGMPAMAAVKSATIVPARYLGIEDRLGSVEPGKLADIVGVPGNPLEDVHALERVSFVMKEGVVYKR
ncbi:MAG TPA: amidohydrolase family protein [Steroidobacteraceae bacterium]|nr:amidohydrolase family protein [Steroidobacteraceae bacterium]